jgi:hypothetical protein
MPKFIGFSRERDQLLMRAQDFYQQARTAPPRSDDKYRILHHEMKKTGSCAYEVRTCFQDCAFRHIPPVDP